MELLDDILRNVEVTKLTGDSSVDIGSIKEDSREVSSGDVFVAIEGYEVDGHRFIADAINKGATAIVYEKEDFLPESGSYVAIKTPDCRKALAYMASAYYGDPSESLYVVGVTGTNGKTSVITMLYRLFRAAGFATGMFSTVEVMINGERQEATHTTPGPMNIQQVLRQMVDQGCSWCFTEVSSHALDQDRVTAIKFKGGIFTNITHDHLDYHKTFDHYLKSKKKLFDNLSTEAFALVNADDKRSGVMVQNCKGAVFRYGLKNPAEYKGKILETDFTGTLLEINKKQVYTTTVGDFNASNLIAAFATADISGIAEEENLKALSRIGNIPGRMQVLLAGDIHGVVDYAHSPDALQKVLETLKRANKQVGNIYTVIGSGGDRDKAKRPEMGQIAANFSEKAIFTSDNPRNEDPMAIINEMKEGVKEDLQHKVMTHPDRKEAINLACALAQKGDVVLVAGKGHEKYQITKGEKHPFDDVAELEQHLKQKA